MNRIAVLTLAICLGTCAGSPAAAQVGPPPNVVELHGRGGQLFVYSVKFLCGTEERASALIEHVTEVNIHNFTAIPSIFAFRHVRAQFAPGTGELGRRTRFEALSPHGAVLLNCNFLDLESVPPSPIPPFVEGFFEITTPIEVNVVAVYRVSSCTQCAQNVPPQTLPIVVQVLPHQPFAVRAVEVIAPK